MIKKNAKTLFKNHLNFFHSRVMHKCTYTDLYNGFIHTYHKLNTNEMFNF